MSKYKQRQHQVVLDKVTMHSRQLALSHASARAAWVHYTSVFLPSVLYPLSLSYIPRSKFEALQKPYTPVLLNKLHFIRSYPRKVAMGPVSHGGLGFKDLYLEAGADALNLIIRHLRSPSNITSLVRVAISTLQFSAGVSYPVLQFPERPIPYLEGRWLPWVRQFLSDINGSLEINDIPVPPLHRWGDRHLMDEAISSQQFNKNELKVINHFRLYLRLVTLSDCCNAAGTHILPAVAAGETSHSQVWNPHHIHQERPHSRWNSLWKRFLAIFTLQKSLQLTHPLQAWREPPAKSPGLWPFYYSPSDKQLYQRMSPSWEIPIGEPLFEVKALAPSSTRMFRHDSIDTVTELPLDSLPVDVNDSAHGWWLESYSKPAMVPTDTPAPETWPEHLATLSPHLREYLAEVQWLFPIVSVYDAVQSLDHIILATDGGAKDRKGSLGWVLSSTDGTRLARGYGYVSGPNPHSFRTEVCALHTGLVLIQELHRFFSSSDDGPTGKLTREEEVGRRQFDWSG